MRIKCQQTYSSTYSNGNFVTLIDFFFFSKDYTLLFLIKS